jgi:hypothetical protein
MQNCSFIVFVAMFLGHYVVAQSLPGLHILDPDPNSGQPHLVQGVNTSEGETWEVPVQVYADSNVEMSPPKVS